MAKFAYANTSMQKIQPTNYLLHVVIKHKGLRRSAVQHKPNIWSFFYKFRQQNPNGSCGVISFEFKLIYTLDSAIVPYSEYYSIFKVCCLSLCKRAC